MADFKDIFPDMEVDVIEAVLRSNNGAVDTTFDQLAAMTMSADNEEAFGDQGDCGPVGSATNLGPDLLGSLGASGSMGGPLPGPSPPPTADSVAQVVKASHFDDLSQNCICIHVAFVELLLPVLQFYVNHKMRDFFLNLLPSQAHMTAEKEIQKKAKKKLSKKKKMESDPLRVLQLQLPLKKAGRAKKGHQMKLSSHSDFAKLYLSKMQLVNFTSLEKCSDVRILLTIMAEVEYFSDEENDLAGKLKGSYHNTAHTQISKFTKQYTRDVLDNLEKLFQIIPKDTKNLEQVKRDLQQVKKYGSQALLRDRTEQEITALRNSLLSNVPPSLKASIEATFRDQEDKLKSIEVVEKKMAGLWQKLPEIGEIFCTELELVSLKGNAANLKSIISTNKP